MEATPLCSLLNKLHFLRRTQRNMAPLFFFLGGGRGVTVFLRRIRNISKDDCWFRHVCLSVHQHGTTPTGTDFNEISYMRIFRKSVLEIQVSLKSDESNGYCTQRPMYVYDNTSLNCS